MNVPSFASQVIHLCAALLLLISFAMLAERRLTRLTHLFLCQGLMLTLTTIASASIHFNIELYFSALLTGVLKVLLLPWVLQRLIRRLHLKEDTEIPLNIPTTMLLGILLVIIAFNVAQPIGALSAIVNRAVLGIALAAMLLSFLMIITRHKAIPQVIAFLSMENCLFFAAMSAGSGMPMMVELGIALDVLIGMIVLGVFFFQMQERVANLDVRIIENMKFSRKPLPKKEEAGV